MEKNIQKDIEQLIISQQINKISLLTKIDSLSKEITDDISLFNKKVSNVENLLNANGNNTISKDDLMSTYLSSEFKEIKESTLKNLRGEIEIKLQREKSKSNNQKNLLILVFIISISSLILSLFTYLQ